MRHRELDVLSLRLDRAAGVLPGVYDHLDEQRANVVIIAAQDTTRLHGAGDVANPTLHSVEQLSQIEYRRTELADFIATLVLCVDLFEQSCRHALAYRVGQWGDPDDSHLQDTRTCSECGQIPSPRTDTTNGTAIDDGRCLDCGRRHDLEQSRRRRETNERRARRHADTHPW